MPVLWLSECRFDVPPFTNLDLRGWDVDGEEVVVEGSATRWPWPEEKIKRVQRDRRRWDGLLGFIWRRSIKSKPGLASFYVSHCRSTYPPNGYALRAVGEFCDSIVDSLDSWPSERPQASS